MLTIDRDDSLPYYQQIYRQIAREIESGSYHEGQRLPSLRQNADDLGVSRNTVEQAYLMLTEQGYVDPRPGSGYIVNRWDPTPSTPTNRPMDEEYECALAQLAKISAEEQSVADVPYDFAYDIADRESFPYATWGKLLHDTMRMENSADICKYPNRRGIPELRFQIAEYLHRERGICASPEQIIVMPMTRSLMQSVLGLFDAKTTKVAVENPGFPEVVHACNNCGFDLVLHDVTECANWTSFANNDNETRLVYVTPSNQYPTNSTMTMESRQALLDWARRNDGYIIEDEYCHEFRYGPAPLPSLHSLDEQGRVIVFGTFSKSFAPATCISYAVLPPQLMLRWLSPEGITHAQVPWVVQRALASFMESGAWNDHLRKIQNLSRRKYHAIIEAVERHMGDKVEYLGENAGLHILIRTKDTRSAQELAQDAEAQGVRLYLTEHQWVDGPPDGWDYLLMGYSGIALSSIDAGVCALSEAWFG